MKLKKMWEQRMLRKKRECDRRGVFVEKGGERPVHLSGEMVSPQVVSNVDEEEKGIEDEATTGNGEEASAVEGM